MKMRVRQSARTIFCRRPNQLAIFDRMFREVPQGQVGLKMPFVRDHERRCEIAVHHPPQIIRRTSDLEVS